MTDSSPIDSKPRRKTLARLEEVMIPDREEFARARALGLTWMAFGVYEVRSSWVVDRDGNRHTGVDVAFDPSLLNLADLPAAIRAKVGVLVEWANDINGTGEDRLVYFPLVVPDALAPAALEIMQKLIEQRVSVAAGPLLVHRQP